MELRQRAPRIVTLNAEHIEDAAQTLADVFLRDEPLTAYLGVCRGEFLGFARDLCRHAVPQGLSVAAVIGEEIAAVRVSTELARDFVPTHAGPKMGMIGEFLAAASTEAKKGVARGVHGQVVAVRPEFRRQGLGRRLLLAGAERALAVGLTVSVGEATSAQNQALVAHLPGYTLRARHVYADYRDDRGGQPFSSLAGHCTVFELDLRCLVEACEGRGG